MPGTPWCSATQNRGSPAALPRPPVTSRSAVCVSAAPAAAGVGAGSVEQREPHTIGQPAVARWASDPPLAGTTATAPPWPAYGASVDQAPHHREWCLHPPPGDSQAQVPEVGPLRGPGGPWTRRRRHRLDGRGLPRHQQVSRGPPSPAPERGERRDRRRVRGLLVVRSHVSHVHPTLVAGTRQASPGSGAVSTPRRRHRLTAPQADGPSERLADIGRSPDGRRGVGRGSVGRDRHTSGEPVHGLPRWPCRCSGSAATGRRRQDTLEPASHHFCGNGP
jgi:hypothetical protein